MEHCNCVSPGIKLTIEHTDEFPGFETYIFNVVCPNTQVTVVVNLLQGIIANQVDEVASSFMQLGISILRS